MLRTAREWLAPTPATLYLAGPNRTEPYDPERGLVLTRSRSALREQPSATAPSFEWRAVNELYADLDSCRPCVATQLPDSLKAL